MRDKTARLLIFVLIIAVFGLLYNDTAQEIRIIRLIEAVRKVEAANARLMQARTAVITITAYSPEVRQTDSTPFTTAFMTKVKSGSVALSWDLIHKGFTPGRCIHAYGYGVFKINDGMAGYWGSRADIFFHSTRQAFRFGIKRNVKIVLMEGC
jgi:3D (Asp-Asp-Asp) domain-containing protein